MGIALCLTLLLALEPSAARERCVARDHFDRIVAAVTERFHDRSFNGLDWPARVSHHRQRLRCAAGEQDVAARSNELFAELRASHTGVFTQGDLDYWGFNSVFSQSEAEHPFPFSGIWARRDGRKWIARYVLEGSPAAAAGVLAGDELLSLNGAGFSPRSLHH